MVLFLEQPSKQAFSGCSSECTDANPRPNRLAFCTKSPELCVHHRCRAWPPKHHATGIRISSLIYCSAGSDSGRQEGGRHGWACCLKWLAFEDFPAQSPQSPSSHTSGCMHLALAGGCGLTVKSPVAAAKVALAGRTRKSANRNKTHRRTRDKEGS